MVGTPSAEATYKDLFDHCEDDFDDEGSNTIPVQGNFAIPPPVYLLNLRQEIQLKTRLISSIKKQSATPLTITCVSLITHEGVDKSLVYFRYR